MYAITMVHHLSGPDAEETGCGRATAAIRRPEATSLGTEGVTCRGCAAALALDIASPLLDDAGRKEVASFLCARGWHSSACRAPRPVAV